MSRKKSSRIKEGMTVDVVPPKNRKDLKRVNLKTWLVSNIFNNTGQYPQLPRGLTARLFRQWDSDWILPVANLKPAADPAAFYA